MHIVQHCWSGNAGWQPPLSQPSSLAQVVFLFGSVGVVSREDCRQPLKAAYPQAHIFGCTTGGEIHGAKVADDSAVATAVFFEHTVIKAAQLPVASSEQSFEAGVELVRRFDPQGLRHLFILTDGLTVNGSDLMDGVNSALPSHVSTSGGCASDGNNFIKTFIWCDSAPVSSAVSALGFYGDRLKLGICATGGWGPFGVDRLITRSRKNILYEVDGQPALALYKKYLGEYATQLPAVGLLFPLELRDSRGGNRLLRALVGIDEAAQSIIFAGNVPEGHYARFMVGDIEDLIHSTHTAAEQCLRNLSAPAELSLIVSCNARRAILKQRVEEELDAVRAVVGERTTMCGFYSFGEIAPGGGLLSELHNETMSITNLTEE